MARKLNAGYHGHLVVTNVVGLDLLNAPADISTGMLCPGDGASVVQWAATLHTAGTGSFNHEIILEHGTGAAGVALTGQLDILADGTPGTEADNGAGLQPRPIKTVFGTDMQVLNAESGSITDGALVNITVLWRL